MNSQTVSMGLLNACSCLLLMALVSRGNKDKQTHIVQTPLCLLQALNVTSSVGFRINDMERKAMLRKAT